MKPTMAAYAKTAAVLILSLGVLTGCIEIPYLQSSSSNNDDRYDFRMSEGNSRIFFFNEADFPFAAYIDGVDVGSVSGRSEYLRAEIPAGTHVIQWKDLRGGSGRPQGETQLVMESGQPYLFRANRSTGRLENVGKAGASELSDKTLVLADPEAASRIPRQAVPVAQKGDSSTSLVRAAASDPQPAQRTIKDKLSELKGLYDSGLITKDEYDGKRKQLLERWN